MEKIAMQPLDFNSTLWKYFSPSVEQKKYESQAAHHQNASKKTRRSNYSWIIPELWMDVKRPFRIALKLNRRGSL